MKKLWVGIGIFVVVWMIVAVSMAMGQQQGTMTTSTSDGDIYCLYPSVSHTECRLTPYATITTGTTVDRRDAEIAALKAEVKKRDEWIDAWIKATGSMQTSLTDYRNVAMATLDLALDEFSSRES